MKKIRISYLVIVITSVFWGSLRAAELPAKTTEKVAMRDGVHLATDIYLPKEKGPFPSILIRTPYNKEATAGLGREGVQHGFAVVIQDTRGRYASEGENLPYHGDGWGKHWDGYDTVEWLAKQPWCNGKIGTMGGSALGTAQLLIIGAGNKKVTAQHLTVASLCLYTDVVFPGGIFKKNLIEDWIQSQKFAPGGLAYWTDHPRHDSFWQERDVRPHFSNANVAAVHLGGWFDIFAQSTVDAFQGFQTKGGPQARGHQKLVMGPWTHSLFVDQAGDLKFPNAKSPPSPVQDPWRWFDFTLKGLHNGMEKEPAVTYYVMGDVASREAPGNTWRTADTWPPFPTQGSSYFFHADHSLSTRRQNHPAMLEYAYDPTNPVPTVGGIQNPPPNGPKDQRPIESRPDMLVFTSDTLEKPLEVTGRVKVKLWVSSDAPDTDFFARLCDVYPDGRSFNICEGQLRARFRNSFVKETRMIPGKTYPLEIDLWSTSIIFNQGHRLRVDVSSSSFPGYDPNPNTGAGFRENSEKRMAHNQIHLDGKDPSQIILPIRQGPRP